MLIENLRVKNYKLTNETEKRMFMKKLTDKPELLRYFSNDRLKVILQWYVNENEKKELLLKK